MAIKMSAYVTVYLFQHAINYLAKIRKAYPIRYLTYRKEIFMDLDEINELPKYIKCLNGEPNDQADKLESILKKYAEQYLTVDCGVFEGNNVHSGKKVCLWFSEDGPKPDDTDRYCVQVSEEPTRHFLNLLDALDTFATLTLEKESTACQDSINNFGMTHPEYVRFECFTDGAYVMVEVEQIIIAVPNRRIQFKIKGSTRMAEDIFFATNANIVNSFYYDRISGCWNVKIHPREFSYLLSSQANFDTPGWTRFKGGKQC